MIRHVRLPSGEGFLRRTQDTLCFATGADLAAPGHWIVPLPPGEGREFMKRMRFLSLVFHSLAWYTAVTEFTR
jgi:hypothetical protein